jgi:hypothetical protein
MNLLDPEEDPTLNFVVTGQVRCGGSVVQTSVTSHPSATCHVDLLHEDLIRRKKNHEDYFGESTNPDAPDWCCPGAMSAEQYLTTRVFDHNKFDELAVGTKLLYSHLSGHDLWEYFNHWCRKGDFCVIHVKRNPVACYVSLKQAQKSGVWHEDINRDGNHVQPRPIEANVKELTEFVRWHQAYEAKVNSMCDDRLEIEYRELFLNYHTVMAEVFDFLSLDRFPDVVPGVRRLKNRNIQARMSNFNTTRLAVPYDVREFFDNDLF